MRWGCFGKYGWFVGGGVPDAPWKPAIAITIPYAVGADSISARNVTSTCRGVGAWRRTTSAAIQQSWPARAVQCPTGALIAARPRNAAPYTRHDEGCRGAHCAPVQFGGCARPRGRTLFAPTPPMKRPPLKGSLSPRYPYPSLPPMPWVPRRRPSGAWRGSRPRCQISCAIRPPCGQAFPACPGGRCR